MNIKSGGQFSPAALKNPADEYAVTYTWVWNSPITKEGIDERLKLYKKIGIRSLYVLPVPIDFSPEANRSFLDPDYLTDEYFELIEYAFRKCISLGITPWIYDEGGWPSGGACYHTVRENPSAKLKFLRKEEVNLISDKRFHPSSEGFVALYRGKTRLPDNYIASGNTTVTAYYIEEKVMNGSRVDYTSASATDTFIKNTYEKYKKSVGDLFGENMPAFFTDEPGLMFDSIAENEFEIFEREYGYDLRDYIYVIENYGVLAVTEEEKRARIDHITLVGKLCKENTYKRLRDWCESNGVYYSGHLDIDNRPYGGTVKGYYSLIDALRCFHIPGIDVIWEQIRYPYGGRAPVNDETLGMGFFPRLAPSAARQEGRNVAVTETFSINGDSITPDEMRYIANYQLVRGINAFNFMTLPYSGVRCAALSARPAFRPEKPGFENLKHINDYYSRLCYLARLGIAECDTALYLPANDFAASQDDLDDANPEFKQLGTRLEERNIQFDIIDDIGIRDCVDTGEGLKLGDALYRHIAVPKNKYMPEDVKAKISHYLGEGSPTYEFKNDKLRVMTRKLDTGRLWFIFNEGIEPVCEIADIAKGKLLYAIDAREGEIYRESVARLELNCGDVAVYLESDVVYPEGSRKKVYTVEAGELTPISYKRFVITYDGLKNEYGDGMPSLGDNFSGEICFECRYALEDEPKAGDKYLVELDGFGVSASVQIGSTCVSMGMTPMWATFDGADFLQNGTMQIRVANTAANEIVAKEDLIRSHPAAEVGPYSARIMVFEKERLPKLKIGKVKISKMS